jgi:hypothetical protein
VNRFPFWSIAAALALATCFLHCTAAAEPSTDSPLDLFADRPAKPADAAPVKTYRSKPPVLVPEPGPADVDLFDLTPSPSVEALKAHADKRLEPGADRPLAVGMTADGVVANYDEAYRLAVKQGKPLRVYVGRAFAANAKEAAGDCVKCQLEDGDARFRGPGVFEYVPMNGGLFERPTPTAPQPQPPSTSTSNAPTVSPSIVPTFATPVFVPFPQQQTSPCPGGRCRR